MAIVLPSILLAIPRNVYTAVGLPLLTGMLSGSSTSKVVRGQWYNELLFPPGRPPRQVFPVVWPILYLSMGYASHLAVKALDAAVSENTREELNVALALYYAQLGLNILWTPLFFGAKETTVALADSVALAGSTYYMTALLHKHTDGYSTYFLAPYCAWLTFATYINAGVVYLNKDRILSKED